MINIIIITLVVLCVVLVWIIRGFSSESTLELKRRARSGDIDSARLYRLQGLYQQQPLLLCTVFLVLALSGVAHLSSQNYSDFVALLIIVTSYFMTIVIGFSIKQTMHIASASSVPIDWILRILSPILKYPTKLFSKFVHFRSEKSFSSKTELLSLIEMSAPESLLSIQERRAVRGALTYADKKITDHLIPNGVVKSIKDSEVLSPVVVGELHDSGYSRFPVFSNPNSVVGILYLKDAANVRTNQLAKEVMRPEVYYLNEEQTLQDALKAFLKTKHHLFMVVNAYEDVVGIITIEDVLEQIIGEKIIDEFDQYEDMKIMASRLADKKREERA